MGLRLPGESPPMEASVTVRPPGPFPPHGEEPVGVVDLGMRMRDQLLTGSVIELSVRPILVERLGSIARAGRLALAPGLTEALLHTWPLASQVDEARERWIEGPDEWALAVLARAARVVSMALGWPDTVDRVWPMPDPEWVLGQVEEGPFRVVPRGPRDGAPAAASILDAVLDHAEPISLPAIEVIQGDELVARVDEVLARAAAGEIVAIRFETPVPWDDASRTALERVHASLPAQRAFERYGHAGLQCPNAPEYEDTLTSAEPATVGERPVSQCDALVMPYQDKQGRAKTAGALTWNDEPHAPVLVHPFAVEVLQLLDGTRTLAEVAAELTVSEELMGKVFAQLAEVGAIQG